MAQSILIFDFASNEEAAQHARHKLEGWKQAFRLGDKLQMKFERVESEVRPAGSADAEEKPAAAKKNVAKKSQAKKASAEMKGENEEKTEQAPAHIRILIRLDFSDHEKLSHQRWLERIAAEEPFKSARAETLRQADEAFDKTSELFDSLD
jgi:hypothetical protein